MAVSSTLKLFSSHHVLPYADDFHNYNQVLKKKYLFSYQFSVKE